MYRTLKHTEIMKQVTFKKSEIDAKLEKAIFTNGTPSLEKQVKTTSFGIGEFTVIVNKEKTNKTGEENTVVFAIKDSFCDYYDVTLN